MNAPFSRTLFDLLSEQSERQPNDVALISGAQTLSYATLLNRARRIAGWLRGRGIRRGERVGILINNRNEWLEICFGAHALGAVVVPFSTWSTRQELDFLLSDSRVKVLFALSRFGDRDFAADLAELVPPAEVGRSRADRFAMLGDVVLIADEVRPGRHDYRQIMQSAATSPDLPPGAGASAVDDAYVLYTSGSSARPKAVRLAHYGVIENGFNIGERQGLHRGDRVLLSPPLFWSYGAANALPAAFTHSAALVLQPKFDAEETIRLIERRQCTAIYTLPGMTSAIVAHPAFNRQRVRSLRTGVTIGSAQEFLQAAEELGIAELCNVYGATETYGNCCVTWHHWPPARRSQCQGPPLPGDEFRFVDVDTGGAVAPGQPGLAEVRGYVTAGYSGASAELNDKMFTADGFYRTGDIGYLNAEGDFVFLGRHAEMIKKAGINVSPAEVEEILLQHPAVAQAAVVGVADRAKGELVVAFVVTASGAKVESQDLVEHCRSLASKYKVPDRIELCSSLPLTSTGKLQRRELKEAAANLVTRARE
jgi:fatty-acyl-CoA synthase